ncbi:MAG: putative mandelate racemase/muconate-lactonizing protein [Paenibacillaceae bacterium]|jgi:L-alanine-DL-glutamate epimerase-like enolase superfamily enzyme|nr:putative mandelate racemase/muconate-lactonizing protein [Paenibacillaceae bacterium]
MHIARVEPIILEVPLERPIVTHFGRLDKRTCLLVKIVSDSGHFGIGEIWNTFPEWGIHEKLATLMHGMAPLLIGEDALDIAGVTAKLHNVHHVLTYHTGMIGPTHHSISGINTALWDLAGRVHGKPICQLLDGGGGVLSGECLQEVPVYASGLNSYRLAETVAEHQRLGIRAFKLRVGADEAQDRRNLETLRGMLQEGDSLMIDANQAWDLATALRRLGEYREFGLRWIEEPVICMQMDDMRIIREETGIPVAAGENYYTPAMFAEAVRRGCVDLVQPDASKSGGISDMIAAIEAARLVRDIPYAPHCLNSAVCLAASIQLFAAVPGGAILEFDSNSNPLREKLFSEPFRIVAGQVAVSQKPGLGYELDEEFIEHHRRRTAIALNI